MLIARVLAATSLTEPLFSHVQAGLRNGLTEEEVNEVLLMVMGGSMVRNRVEKDWSLTFSGYTGFPRGLQA